MSAGGSSGSSDTRFERNGTAGTTSWRDLTPEHTNLFQTGLNASNPGTLGPGVQNHVTQTLGYGNDSIPFEQELGKIISSNLPGAVVPGQSGLQAQAGIDPYSTTYADNTQARYLSDLGKSISSVSGPTATRGGTAAQGFMAQEALNSAALNREDLITRNRQADAGIQQGASAALHGMQSRDTAEALQGIGQQQSSWGSLLGSQNSAAGLGNQQAGLFSELAQNYANLGAVVNGTETNNLYGRGAQTSSSQAANLSLCCFIFLEGLNGKLPWWVRECRDQWAPECSERRNGYIRMSNWLVPAMKKSKLVKWLVNTLMIKPMTKWGGYYHKVKGYKLGLIYYPVVKFWFKLWKITGKKK